MKLCHSAKIKELIININFFVNYCIELWVSEFTIMENSQAKVIFIITWNHVSLPFYVVNSCSCLIHVISAIAHEMTLKLACFSLKITINGENCQSRISCFTQMASSEITFILDSRKFLSRPITNST